MNATREAARPKNALYKKPWAEITIDTDRPMVKVDTKWEVTWLPAKAWSDKEKKTFWAKAAAQVRSFWNRDLTVKGTAPFCQRHKTAPLVFDLQLAGSKDTPHYKATITKIPKGKSAGLNSINFGKGTATFNTIAVDMAPNSTTIQKVSRCTGPTSRPTPKGKQYFRKTYNGSDYICSKNSFPIVAHEFGHGLGNVDDEYYDKPGQDAHFTDFKSLMNLGHETRSRHYEPLLKELNGVGFSGGGPMIPGCTFSAR